MPFTYGIDESVSNFNLARKQDWELLYLYSYMSLSIDIHQKSAVLNQYNTRILCITDDIIIIRQMDGISRTGGERHVFFRTVYHREQRILYVRPTRQCSALSKRIQIAKFRLR